VIEPTYLELQTREDTPQGHAIRRYWKGHYLQRFDDEVIDAFLLRGSENGTGPLLPNVSLQAYGGAIADVPDDATAFSHRRTVFEFVSSSGWSDAGEDAGRIAAGRRCGADSHRSRAVRTSTSSPMRAPRACDAPTPRRSSPGSPR
jgi:hypothetical protein